MSDRPRSERTFLMARIWWCEDEVCDCYQPEILKYIPAPPGQWRRTEVVWKGEFVSQPDLEDRERIRAELLAEAAKYGISINQELWAGEKEVEE